MLYTYTYLLLNLFLLAVWLVLFWIRKDTRKELLFMSIFFGCIGPIMEIVYIRDWWNPQTITGTVIGIEDFLFGFMVGGIASVIYEDLFKRRVKVRKKASEAMKSIHILGIMALSGFIFFFCFFALRLNSLMVSILMFVIPTSIIYVRRKDLIVESLVTGILMVIIAAIVYTVLNLIQPGWIHAFWYFKNVPNMLILNLPLDDLIWYFLAGMFIGPLYEYWQEGRLVKVTGRDNQQK